MNKAVIASVSGAILTDDEKRLLSQLKPVGISLFARNVINKSQLSSLVKDIKTLLGEQVLIAVDQEGGRVRRLREPEWRSYASEYVLGQLPVEISALHAMLIAQDLQEIGINFNYAPVLDTPYPQTHQVLKSRCFSSNISEHGQAMIEAYIANGICPCIKHLPGHGRAQTDPHLGLPVIEGSLADLERDIAPFVANNNAPAGMTAHIVLPQYDILPATMSPKIIKEIIRGEIGFDGLLISDAIEMGALHGTLVERCTQALAAGCDVVCYCGGKTEDLAALAQSCPDLSEQAEQRLAEVKGIISVSTKTTADYGLYSQAVGKIDAYVETYDATEVLNRMSK